MNENESYGILEILLHKKQICDNLSQLRVRTSDLNLNRHRRLWYYNLESIFCSLSENKYNYIRLFITNIIINLSIIILLF
jgi:hypothetical protein